jgi:hypothetical protein
VDEEAKQKHRRRRTRLLGSLGCLGLMLLILLVSPVGLLLIPLRQVWCEYRNESSYSRDPQRYEAIVRHLAALKLPSRGQPYCFSISPKKEAHTLHRVDPATASPAFDRASETELVMAFVDDGGRLGVRICTDSLGHAGVYGLYYSSAPPAPGEVENSFGMGGRTKLVAPNWWCVADYSQ